MRGSNYKLQARSHKLPPGFTLLEMVVVVGIFAMLAVVFVDVYLLALRAQRQTAGRQTVITSLRNALETMATHIRTEGIQYEDRAWDLDGDAGIQGDEIELHTVDSRDVIHSFYASNGVLYQVDDYGGSGQEAALTDASLVRVDGLTFFISPITDPFRQEQCNEDVDCLQYTAGPTEPVWGCTLCSGGTCPSSSQPTGRCRCASDSHCQVTQRCDTSAGLCVPFDVQPHVTINLTFTSLGSRPEEQKTISLQTTVTSRQYLR